MSQNKKQESVTVSLPCPDCSEKIEATVIVCREDYGGGEAEYFLDFANPQIHEHVPEIEEPMEFGAKVQVTRHDGWKPRFVRVPSEETVYKKPWLSESAFACTWDELCEIGKVRIGWSN